MCKYTCKCKKNRSKIGLISLGTSPINGVIYAGRLNKDKTMWIGEKQVITDDAIRAVFEKMMQESEMKNGADIEYSYQGFGKIRFTKQQL